MPYRSRPPSPSPYPSRQRISLAAAGLTVFLSTLAIAAFAPANAPSEPPAPKPGVVKTIDGNTFQGDIAEQTGMIVVKDKRGIETRIKRQSVASIDYAENIEFEYDRRHRDLAPSDVEARVDLARYCLAQKRPDLARLVLVEALTLNPNDRDASALYDVAKGQLEIDRKAANRDPSALPPKPATAKSSDRIDANHPGENPTDSANPETPPVLTPEQVNRIRQVELRQSDTTMTFKFENAVEKRYALKTMTPVGAFNSLTPFERFILLRDRKEWGLLKDVKLSKDPQALAFFRQAINPVLLSGCATSGCHGSGGGGLPLSDRPFQLRNVGDKESRDYTNFYILATSSFKAAGANGAAIPMIDRLSPERSLLLQYGLRAPQAQFPHPAVKGYKGLLESANDPKYQVIYRWIRDSLTPQPEEYQNFGIVLGPPPTVTPSTRRGTAPTTMASASLAPELPPPTPAANAMAAQPAPAAGGR